MIGQRLSTYKTFYKPIALEAPGLLKTLRESDTFMPSPLATGSESDLPLWHSTGSKLVGGTFLLPPEAKLGGVLVFRKRPAFLYVDARQKQVLLLIYRAPLAQLHAEALNSSQQRKLRGCGVDKLPPELFQSCFHVVRDSPAAFCHLAIPATTEELAFCSIDLEMALDVAIRNDFFKLRAVFIDGADAPAFKMHTPSEERLAACARVASCVAGLLLCRSGSAPVAGRGKPTVSAFVLNPESFGQNPIENVPLSEVAKTMTVGAIYSSHAADETRIGTAPTPRALLELIAKMIFTPSDALLLNEKLKKASETATLSMLLGCMADVLAGKSAIAIVRVTSDVGHVGGPILLTTKSGVVEITDCRLAMLVDNLNVVVLRVLPDKTVINMGVASIKKPFTSISEDHRLERLSALMETSGGGVVSEEALERAVTRALRGGVASGVVSHGPENGSSGVASHGPENGKRAAPDAPDTTDELDHQLKALKSLRTELQQKRLRFRVQ